MFSDEMCNLENGSKPLRAVAHARWPFIHGQPRSRFLDQFNHFHDGSNTRRKKQNVKRKYLGHPSPVMRICSILPSVDNNNFANVLKKN